MRAAIFESTPIHGLMNKQIVKKMNNFSKMIIVYSQHYALLVLKQFGWETDHNIMKERC